MLFGIPNNRALIDTQSTQGMSSNRNPSFSTSGVAKDTAVPYLSSATHQGFKTPARPVDKKPQPGTKPQSVAAATQNGQGPVAGQYAGFKI